MKKFSTPLCNFFLLIGLVLVSETKAQEVGIGTLAPDHKLHVASNTSTLLKLDNTTNLNTGIMSEMYFKTGMHYTGALKTIGNGTVTARLGFFTYAVTNPTSLLERMSIMDDGKVGIGINNPGYLLDVNGRARVRQTPGNTAGLVLMESTNMTDRGFVGMKDDNEIGFYGYDGGGWGLTMETNTGDVSIVSSQLYVTSSDIYTGYFSNNSGADNPAIEAVAENVSGFGIGVEAQGGEYGVFAIADEGGGGNHHYGIYAAGRHGNANNYGVYADGFSGNNAYGIFASASSGSNSTWAGYFSGSVYTTGSYQGSDRKLKSDIRPLDNAIELIKELKPTTYQYKTSEYQYLELPKGNQFGLIADEVKQVFPSLVRTAVQPAMYENRDERNGKMLADEVSFEAVNYTAMIPVMIAAMQEQQVMIEALQGRISELEAKMK